MKGSTGMWRIRRKLPFNSDVEGVRKIGKAAEHRETYTNENRVELENEMKAEYSTDEEMQKALSFMAQSLHNFYFEMAKEIYSCLNCGRARIREKREYFVCPECGRELCNKENLPQFEDNYCGNCGCNLSSAREKALALLRHGN